MGRLKSSSSLFTKQIQKLLNMHSTKNTFLIAHRVNEILDNTKIGDWYYLSTEYNVADKTSRYQELPL